MIDEDKLWEIKCRLVETCGFEIWPEQTEILQTTNRIILVSGGEQAGKSVVAGLYCILAMIEMAYSWAFEGKKGKALYWLVGADYEQSRREFDYIKEGLVRLGEVHQKDISTPQKGPWHLTALSGKIDVFTKTAMDVRKLAREAPNGILINEAAQVDYDVYLKCLGRTAPKRGFLFLSGTLESATDWYSEKLTSWQAPNAEEARAFILPSWANRKLYPQGREDPEIARMEKNLPHDIFMMRFGAVAQPPSNLCLPEFNYKTHVPGDIAYDETLPVQLWIDPGYVGSYYSIEVAQLIKEDLHCKRQHVHIVDEIYVQQTTTGFIIEDCRMRPWWDNVEQVVIDVAGTQHQAMPSHAEMWNAELGVPVLYQRVEPEDGILRHRTFLRDPSSGEARIFYNEGCSGALREYGRWLRTETSGLRNQAAKPKITNCDAMKAIQYGLIANFGFVEYGGEPLKITSPFSY